jgi:predicted permease
MRKRRTLRQLWARLISCFRPAALDRELDAEIAFHLAMAAADYERAGHPPDVARRLAAARFGGRDAAIEKHRDARAFPLFEQLHQDVRYALRGFRREPGFTAAAVLVLALGIGANTAVFSVVNPLLLRPLPFPEPERLVWLQGDEGTSSLSSRTYRVAVFEEFQQRLQSLSASTAYFAFFNYFHYTLKGPTEPERVVGVQVGPQFFETLGVRPALGRSFVRAELKSGDAKVAVLTHSLFQRRFSADPQMIGRTMVLNREPVTIVGVLPASFDFSSVFTPGGRVDFFLPARLDDMRDWGNTLAVIGRLRPSVSVEEARAEIGAVLPQILKDHPDWGSVQARLLPLQEHVTAGMRRPLFVLWGAVAVVLAIVCVNLANLLLARGAARGREFALRIALGAGQGRLVRQVLTEGVLLASAGAALGVPFAIGLTRGLTSGDLQTVPLLHYVRVDGAALLVTAGVSLAAGVLFAIVPALRASQLAPSGTLQEHSRGSLDSVRHVRTRRALVVLQVGMAAVLLVTAGLLGRSFVQLLHVDLGFEPAGAVAGRLDTTWPMSPEQKIGLYDEVSRRAAALPDVEAVGLTDALPLDRDRTWNVGVPGRRYDERTPMPLAFVYVVGPGYCRAMGIELREGRDFLDSDTALSRRVALVNETLANQLYPGRHAIGRRLMTGGGEADIVGIVADVRQSRLDETGVPQVYLAYAQSGGGGLELIVRTAMPPSVLAPMLRKALAEVDPRLTATEIRPIRTLVERALSPQQFLLSLLLGFSAVALLLAAIGIYGVVAYAASQRIPEFGVRMALGANASHIRRLVLVDSLRLTALGLVLGLAGSLAMTRVVTSLLFATSPTDPATFAAMLALLAAVAVLAAYLPAHRASHTEPIRALRVE